MSSDNSDYSTMSDKELDEEINSYEKALIIAKKQFIVDVEHVDFWLPSLELVQIVLNKAKKEKERRQNN